MLPHQSGKLSEALDKLFALEKQTRNVRLRRLEVLLSHRSDIGLRSTINHASRESCSGPVLQSPGLCPAQCHHQPPDQEARTAQGRRTGHGGAGNGVAGGN